AATIMTGLSGSVASLVVFRVLVGLGEGGAFPTATRALTGWVPVRERGFAQGITHSAARLGGAVTPPIVVALVVSYGWRQSFVVLGALSLVWTIVWVAWFRNSPAEHSWVTPAEIREIGLDAESIDVSRRATPWRAIVQRMWIVTLVDFCYGWSLWVFLTWLPS